MTVFSSDSDILRHEGVLFSELFFPWQILCEGTGGTLSGTTFSQTGADLTACSISGGGVIYMRSDDGGIDGLYEIVSVDSATSLTVSVLRADSEASIVVPGDGNSISYRISTFEPQANEVMFELTRYFGVQPGNPESEYTVVDIVDAEVLRQVSTYAVIAGIYATLGSRSDDGAGFWEKSLYYQRLFERARERCRVGIDIDGNGSSEFSRSGGSIKLNRG